MQIIATDFNNPDATVINAAVTVLRNGEIIAYLTDTLYGLGGDARSTVAIEKVFSLKGRMAEKALPVIIGEKNMLHFWVEEIPPVAATLMASFWPGPLTLIFKASAHVPPLLVGNTGKIAIRLPAARLACEISTRLGAPIIATSANRSAEPVADSARQIAEIFGKSLALILDSGSPPHRQPSTILDVTLQPPRLVRAGAVPAEEIIKRIGDLQT
ncbi:MAG: L-threonylcarbamoyladenylate synthase [candidate division KSB1 bacterium]|nr:L-threonylcarbamoyladenylate synthase [candidate division KSB1 bacterium]MDZ7301897.1 L-threonylcarbamoyladenylate synthase [candidate division KSB1 bacterium]MDZ7310280.1 L-threonylcarbamoyladenylate synthase [candidate division KSB1 bacterium]